MSTLSDEELRALVRDAIARLRPRSEEGSGVAVARPSGLPAAGLVHASHVRFLLGPGGDETGACVIEPDVRCTHCGYCQSLGH